MYFTYLFIHTWSVHSSDFLYNLLCAPQMGAYVNLEDFIHGHQNTLIYFW